MLKWTLKIKMEVVLLLHFENYSKEILMLAKKILIIEDEEITAIALETYLESLGYIITDSVNNAKDALISVQKNRPDLVLSDIIIVGAVSGCEVSQEIHARYNIPIIFLTAHLDDEMLDYATDAEAYAYILKPFQPFELKTAIRLALNHHHISIDNKIYFGNYVLSQDTITKNNQIIRLGKKSLKLITLLANNANRVLSYQELLHALWEEDKDIDTLRHLVKRTKEKLGKDIIVSIKNIGYKLGETEKIF